MFKNERTIHYLKYGQQEPTLVFIHCWTCDSSFWHHQIDYFKHRYRVISIDLAGHGQSSPFLYDFSIKAYARDVASVAVKSAHSKVILIGHEIGGPVALETAEILGDKVLKIITVNSFYTPFLFPQNESSIENFIAPFKVDYHRNHRQLIRSMFSETTPHSLVEKTIKEMQSVKPELAIGALRRYLLWHLNRKNSLLRRHAVKLHHINTHKSMSVLHGKASFVSGSGQYIPIEQPDAFNKKLSYMLSY